MGKLRVLMMGPGRMVKGGISTVVNNYYGLSLDKQVDLTYLPTMEDGSKVKKLIVAVSAYMRFGRLVRNCDIVHVHMAAQASFSRKAIFIEKAHKAEKKIIIHQHAADFDKFFFKESDNAKREKIKYIFSIADKVIVLSEEWASFFGKNVCAPEKIEILYNGVVLPEHVKEDYHDHNVLMLGRLGQRKGTYDLLKAIPKVVESIPDVMFYLGGDGDVEQCKRIVEEYNLERHVSFLGWVRDKEKEKQLKRCSTFILPSYHEGMPMSVLEAMSYGLATISSNAGGIPQIIDDGFSGIRVDAGSVDAIAAILIHILESEEERKRLGKNGRLKIEQKFDFRVNVTQLVRIYHHLAEEN